MRYSEALLRGLRVLAGSVACSLILAQSPLRAVTLFESGELGTTGLARGDVPAANVSGTVFNGVRFEISETVLVTQVGGHFVGSPSTNDTLFGCIVALEDGADFPNSGDLSTPDVLAHTILEFPNPSDEIFADLNVTLQPGWYALVFGSGLFGASGDGAMPLNNADFGTPSYVAFQPGQSWFNLADVSDAFRFEDFRMVVLGDVVPEPPAARLFAGIAALLMACRRLRSLYRA